MIAEKQDRKLYLVIAGKGSEERNLKYLAKDYLDRIFFLGFRNDIEKVLGGLDILVHASKAIDGIPQVVTQAMALSKPVIATDVGGITDVIKDNETGWLIKPGSVDELEDKLNYVYSISHSERDKISRNGYQYVKKELTIRNTVLKYIEAYNMAARK